MSEKRFLEIALQFFRYSFADCKGYEDLTLDEKLIITEEEYTQILKRLEQNGNK